MAATSSSAKPLFVYGSLMHNRVLTAVIKHDATKVASFSASPATLHNHHRFQIKERSYPALVPKPNSKVDGVLLRGLSSEDQQRLDDFEGDDYIRTLVTVIDSRNETTCEAWVYIWSKGASDPLLYGEWDYHRDFIPRMEDTMRLWNFD